MIDSVLMNKLCILQLLVSVVNYGMANVVSFNFYLDRAHAGRFQVNHLLRSTNWLLYAPSKLQDHKIIDINKQFPITHGSTR